MMSKAMLLAYCQSLGSVNPFPHMTRVPMSNHSQHCEISTSISFSIQLQLSVTCYVGSEKQPFPVLKIQLCSEIHKIKVSHKFHVIR